MELPLLSLQTQGNILGPLAVLTTEAVFQCDLDGDTTFHLQWPPKFHLQHFVLAHESQNIAFACSSSLEHPIPVSRVRAGQIIQVSMRYWCETVSNPVCDSTGHKLAFLPQPRLFLKQEGKRTLPPCRYLVKLQEFEVVDKAIVCVASDEKEIETRDAEISEQNRLVFSSSLQPIVIYWNTKAPLRQDLCVRLLTGDCVGIARVCSPSTWCDEKDEKEMVPRNIILALDLSKPMHTARLDKAVASAAMFFLQCLPLSTSKKQLFVSLVFFGSTAQHVATLVEFTEPGKKQLLACLESDLLPLPGPDVGAVLRSSFGVYLKSWPQTVVLMTTSHLNVLDVTAMEHFFKDQYFPSHPQRRFFLLGLGHEPVETEPDSNWERIRAAVESGNGQLVYCDANSDMGPRVALLADWAYSPPCWIERTTREVKSKSGLACSLGYQDKWMLHPGVPVDVALIAVGLTEIELVVYEQKQQQPTKSTYRVELDCSSKESLSPWEQSALFDWARLRILPKTQVPNGTRQGYRQWNALLVSQRSSGRWYWSSLPEIVRRKITRYSRHAWTEQRKRYADRPKKQINKIRWTWKVAFYLRKYLSVKVAWSEVAQMNERYTLAMRWIDQCLAVGG